MGVLRRSSGGEARSLLSQHLVGRGLECALRLGESYVSGQHALIRWEARAWEVIDRGSRNGTRLNGQPLDPGRPYHLKQGDTLSFGHVDERWLLSDADAPEVSLIALENGEALSGTSGLIGLFLNDTPVCTLFRDVDGSWKLEDEDGSVRRLSDGETLECGGRSYRFSLPSATEATASVDGGSALEKPTLRFTVSSDEEFVELFIEYGGRSIPLGSRSLNYFLLTLARAYLRDAAAGVAPPSCGWLDKEDLARDLRMTPEQIDGEVFRVKRHFAKHQLKEAATILERRPRTKQIRIGIGELKLERK